MKTELTKPEIRLILLEIADHLEKICKLEGLQYFIFYGTLLGAVRHSGFISWDDDFDVVMLENDVHRLVEAFQKYPNDNIRLLCQQTSPIYKDWVFRLVDTRTTVTESITGKQVANTGLGDRPIGLALDIYPLIGGFQNVLLQKILSVLYSIDFKISKKFQKIKLFYWIAETFRKFSSEKCYFTRADYKLTYEKPSIFPGLPLTFENKEFLAPTMASNILTARYGDYMTPPSEDEIAQWLHYETVSWVD